MLPSFYGGKTAVCLPLKYLVIRKLIALQSEIIEYSIWVFKNLIARVKSDIFDLKAHHELRTYINVITIREMVLFFSVYHDFFGMIFAYLSISLKNYTMSNT